MRPSLKRGGPASLVFIVVVFFFLKGNLSSLLFLGFVLFFERECRPHAQASGGEGSSSGLPGEPGPDTGLDRMTPRSRPAPKPRVEHSID